LNRRVVVLIVGLVGAVVLFAVAMVVVIALGVLKLMDRTDARVCGLAIVQRSPAAARLAGAPIVQKGFTGGRTSENNGELYERITFTVAGPRGDAFVLSEGTRSPLGSHLTVTIGREQRSQTIYSGPFDCPELHEKR